MAQGGETSGGRVVVSGRERWSPEGHDGIADILLKDAVVGADLFREDGKVAVEQLDHSSRGELLANLREPFEVCEEHGGDATLRLIYVVLRGVNELSYDARVHVLAKGVFDPLFRSQLLGHAIEGQGELADLVPAGNRNGHLQISRLNGLGPFHDPPEPPNEALGAGRAQAQAEDHRDYEQDDVHAQEASLLRVQVLDRGPGQRDQLVPHRGQVRPDRWLEVLEPEGQASGLGELAGVVCGQDLVPDGEEGRLDTAEVEKRALHPGQHQPVVAVDPRIGEGAVDDLARAREVLLNAALRPVERAADLVGRHRHLFRPAQEPLDDQLVLVGGDVQIGDSAGQGQVDIDDSGSLGAGLLLHDDGADEDGGEEQEQDTGDGENLTANRH